MWGLSIGDSTNAVKYLIMLTEYLGQSFSHNFARFSQRYDRQ
jgi:hypothetical protein